VTGSFLMCLFVCLFVCLFFFHRICGLEKLGKRRFSSCDFTFRRGILLKALFFPFALCPSFPSFGDLFSRVRSRGSTNRCPKGPCRSKQDPTDNGTAGCGRGRLDLASLFHFGPTRVHGIAARWIVRSWNDDRLAAVVDSHLLLL